MSSPASAASPREEQAVTPAPLGGSAQHATRVPPTNASDGDDEADHKSDAGSDTKPDDASGEKSPADVEDAPPLPSGAVPDRPMLNESAPQPGDDGWDCQWDPNAHAWFFYNRFTGMSQWDNPRVPNAAGAPAESTVAAPGTAQALVPQPPTDEQPAAGGYNPAIHGDYDPTAWYAQGNAAGREDQSAALLADPSAGHGATAAFNRHTGQFQTADAGPERHSDEAKSKRQMNAYFDVDAAANAHGGRSLKAERSNKKPSKNELKAFKEKRRARKEEKRRAWLRD